MLREERLCRVGGKQLDIKSLWGEKRRASRYGHAVVGQEQPDRGAMEELGMPSRCGISRWLRYSRRIPGPLRLWFFIADTLGDALRKCSSNPF
jgi:hypothetical protein